MKTLRRMGITWLVLVSAYLILMTAVYAIPNAWISDNVNGALAVIHDEGYYPDYFFDYPFGQADNVSDEEMYRNILADDGASALTAAMVPRYSRYWQGYALFLRPLSIFLSIANIRYLNMIVLLGLLALCTVKISEAIHPAAAAAFLLGLAATFLWLAPFNMQYFTVTALTLVFSWVIVAARRRWNHASLPILFLCFGSLTNFFDYLTFPILTLGYPLILLLLLRRHNGESRTFASELRVLLVCSAAWCGGYAFTLLAKGVFGTLILGTNVLGEILQYAAYRVDGALPDGYRSGVSAWMAISYNLNAFFNMRNLCMFAASLLWFLLMALRRPGSGKGWKASLPLLGVALFPYVWYAVLQNHSIMHCYFTFKAQAVTYFGVSAYVISLIDFSGKPKKLLTRREHKRRFAKQILPGALHF